MGELWRWLAMTPPTERSRVSADAPERLFLQTHDNPNDPFAWTHCADQINDDDVEYVRADALEALAAENERQKEAYDEACLQLVTQTAELTRLREERSLDVARAYADGSLCVCSTGHPCAICRDYVKKAGLTAHEKGDESEGSVAPVDTEGLGTSQAQQVGDTGTAGPERSTQDEDDPFHPELVDNATLKTIQGWTLSTQDEDECPCPKCVNERAGRTDLYAPDIACRRSTQGESGEEMSAVEAMFEIAKDYGTAPCFNELLGEVDPENPCTCPTCGHRAILNAYALRLRTPSKEPEPVDQRGPHDCYTACLATLTGLPLEDMPSPPDVLEREAEIAYGSAVKRHLIANGWMVLGGYDLTPRGLSIACGPSPRNSDIWHCVVVRDGELVHDPHPDREGIARAESYEIVVPLVAPPETPEES